jgi:hypothetical protein
MARRYQKGLIRSPLLIFTKEAPKDLVTSHKYLILAAAQGLEGDWGALLKFFQHGAPIKARSLSTPN